jgi:hypothetical protein
MNVTSDQDITVMVRALTDKGEIQDLKLEDCYNIRGLMSNQPHQVSFSVKA